MQKTAKKQGGNATWGRLAAAGLVGLFALILAVNPDPNKDLVGLEAAERRMMSPLPSRSETGPDDAGRGVPARRPRSGGHAPAAGHTAGPAGVLYTNGRTEPQDGAPDVSTPAGPGPVSREAFTAETAEEH